MTNARVFLVMGLATALTWGCNFNPGARSSGLAGSGGGTGSGAGGGGVDAAGVTGAGGGGVITGGGGSVATSGSGGATATTGAGGSTTTGGAGGTAGTIGTTGTGGSSGATGCDPAGPQCNNCKDDDGDGLVDAADPECIGPLDNDESTFATGIPGDNVDACKQDCFFDGNSGMGDDGCEWNLKCDPLSPGATAAKPCPYDASYRNCPTAQSQRCLDTCRTVTPNGCDCFGCCLVPGAPNAIYLAPTCTAANFDDPSKCPPCTQVTSCLNTCGHCEICVGKTTLPLDCTVTGTGGSGGGAGAGGAGGAAGSGGAGGGVGTGGAGGGGAPCYGQPYCGPGGIDPATCPAGTYCITGCCIPGIG